MCSALLNFVKRMFRSDVVILQKRYARFCDFQRVVTADIITSMGLTTQRESMCHGIPEPSLRTLIGDKINPLMINNNIINHHINRCIYYKLPLILSSYQMSILI